MLIDRFLSIGREFLGCNYPIMCGAMTWVSDPQLVSAVGNCGGFGLLAGGNAPVEVLKSQIQETRQMTDHPFGVNIITLAPAYKDQLNSVSFNWSCCINSTTASLIASRPSMPRNFSGSGH